MVVVSSLTYVSSVLFLFFIIFSWNVLGSTKFSFLMSFCFSCWMPSSYVRRFCLSIHLHETLQYWLGTNRCRLTGLRVSFSVSWPTNISTCGFLSIWFGSSYQNFPLSCLAHISLAASVLAGTQPVIYILSLEPSFLVFYIISGSSPDL